MPTALSCHFIHKVPSHTLLSESHVSAFEKLLVNQTIAHRYHIERLLGRGGMGAVYEAHDERLSRPVAIKLLSIPSYVAEDTAKLRRRFLREARTAARFHHPNIVQIHDFGTDVGLDFDYLVMELLVGEDLGAVLKRERALTPGNVRKYLIEAAEGLAEGHAHGIVHRDVKPSNLFLARRGRLETIILLDFGIAQLPATSDETQSHLTRAGMVPCSPAYASPEQEAGDSHLTPASDVYSLGVTALALLSGAPPKRPWAIHPSELGPYAQEVREGGLLSVIDLCVRRNRAERLPDGASVVEALGSLSDSNNPHQQRSRDTWLNVALDANSGEQSTKQAAGLDAPRSAPTSVGIFKRPIRTRTLLGAILATWLVAFLWNDVFPPQRSAPTSLPPSAIVPATRKNPLLRSTALGENTRHERTSQRRAQPTRTRRQEVQASSPAPAEVDNGKVLAEPAAAASDAQKEQDLIVQPEVTNREEVNRWMSRHYPPLLRDAGVMGTVTLSACVLADGSVEPGSVRVVAASHETFGDAAIPAVQRMHFRPATRNGVPIRDCVTIPVTYSLEQ